MIKNNLKHFRHKKEMNQTEFADFLGVDRRQYNRWENQKPQPSLEFAIKISKKLNCRIDDLFEIIE